MIPLILEDAKIQALKRFAENNPMCLSELHQIIQGKLPPAGDREGNTLFLDYGFKLVFSIEEHPRASGGTVWGRHMSVSLTEPTGERVPSIVAVKILAEALGFKPLDECYMHFEKDNDPMYVEVFCEMEEG